MSFWKDLRQGLLDNLKKAIGGKKSDISGSQRSLSLVSYGQKEQWDLEIEENPIRNPNIARQLIEISKTCYEAKGCLRMAIEDVFADEDGDDQDSWTVSDFVDKNETIPINPITRDIILDLMIRKENSEDYVIGGDKLKGALKKVLTTGDCFAEIGIGKDINGDYQVSNVLFLPSWELFRIEDDHGVLEGFEQRQYLSESSPSIYFSPVKICHMRYDTDNLYGTSMFYCSIPYWANLKQAVYDLKIAARVLAMNPNKHMFPEDMTQTEADKYRYDNENRKRKGEIITDIYLPYGMDVEKISNINPNLKPLCDTVLEWRARMVVPGFPTYNFPNFPSQKARDISGEPSKRYKRMRNNWCNILSKALRKIIDTEIVLKMGYDWFEQNGQYRIIWSKLMLDEEENINTGINDRGNEGNEENEEE